MKLVHWPLMGGLLHLIQRGSDWAGWKRQRGRPCRTWVQQIEDDTGLNANDAWRIAQWPQVLEGATTRGRSSVPLTDWLTDWYNSEGRLPRHAARVLIATVSLSYVANRFKYLFYVSSAYAAQETLDSRVTCRVHLCTRGFHGYWTDCDEICGR